METPNAGAPELSADQLFQQALQVEPPQQGTEPPNTAQSGATQGAEAAGKPADATVQKIKVGDEEFDTDTLKSLIEKAKSAEEITAASTRRFQEAAETKKQGELLISQHQELAALGQQLAKLPEEAQKQLFALAAQLDEAYANGGTVTPSTGPLTSFVPAGAEMPKIPDWKDLSDEGRALVALFAPAYQELQQLRAHVGKVNEILPDVTDFVNGTREQRSQAAAAVSISQTYGTTVTPEEVSAAMKATGIKDPEGAWLKQNTLKLMANAHNNGAQQRTDKPIETPSGESNAFDPKGMTTDEIFRKVMAGGTPLSS